MRSQMVSCDHQQKRICSQPSSKITSLWTTSISSCLDSRHQLLGVDDAIHSRIQITDIDLQRWATFLVLAVFSVKAVHLEDVLSSQPSIMILASKLPTAALCLTCRADHLGSIAGGANCFGWTVVKDAAFAICVGPLPTSGAWLGDTATKCP